MNEILSIIVDATIKHSMGAHKNETNCTKNAQKQRKLERYIIKEYYLVFGILRKMHGVCKFDSNLDQAIRL